MVSTSNLGSWNDRWKFTWVKLEYHNYWILNLTHTIPNMSKAISGWWYTYPSEKYEFVSWDDYSIPNWMESHKIPWFQHHQPAYCYKSFTTDFMAMLGIHRSLTHHLVILVERHGPRSAHHGKGLDGLGLVKSSYTYTYIIYILYIYIY